MTLLLILALLSIVAVAASIVAIARDGYGWRPHLSRRRASNWPR